MSRRPYPEEMTGYVEYLIVDSIRDAVGLSYSTMEKARAAQAKWDAVAPYNGPHRILKRTVGPWEDCK